MARGPTWTCQPQTSSSTSPRQPSEQCQPSLQDWPRRMRQLKKRTKFPQTSGNTSNSKTVTFGS
ncbi:hypothetical protein DPMN_029101 [Dreissena polymorpha]|uniref:Uncharacterized protein n=1 Tax=Dreissena polymorpha TaxID=45954 RepID=A0A9D4LXI6_DREPO|nr:hypothetical protein DPMN_029101 [Dreissena polymorpha]